LPISLPVEAYVPVLLAPKYASDCDTQAPVKGPPALVPHTVVFQVPAVPLVFQYCVAALASVDQPANERVVNIAIANEWFNFLLILFGLLSDTNVQTKYCFAIAQQGFIYR
jgi:hypothetical protein